MQGFFEMYAPRLLPLYFSKKKKILRLQIVIDGLHLICYLSEDLFNITAQLVA